MHANKRRCVEKALLGKFKDKLVEVFGRHVKRIYQGRLDSAGYLGDPAFVVPAFDYVDFGERHEWVSFALGRQIRRIMPLAQTKRSEPKKSGPPLLLVIRGAGRLSFMISIPFRVFRSRLRLLH